MKTKHLFGGSHRSISILHFDTSSLSEFLPAMNLENLSYPHFPTLD